MKKILAVVVSILITTICSGCSATDAIIDDVYFTKLYAETGNFTSIYSEDAFFEALTINSDLDMSTHRIHNVVDPESAQDAATKQYVDEEISGSIGGSSNGTFTKLLVGGTLALASGNITDSTGNINFGSENLTTTGNITGANLLTSLWNTAYSWGNHALVGYLTSITSTNVTVALGYTPADNATTIAALASKVPVVSVFDSTKVGEWLLFYNDIGNTAGSVYDYSGNGNTGTVTGATYGSLGRTFDGSDDKIALPAAVRAATSVAANFSVEAWVNTTLLNTEQYAYASAISSSNRFAIVYYNGSIRGGLWNGAVYSGLQSEAISINTWYHIVYTFTAPATGKLYINTVPATGTSTTYTASNVATYIGRMNNDTYSWSGTIGEVRIKNYAMTAQEVMHNYLVTKWRYGL